MVEQADTRDLKSRSHKECGFNPRSGHHFPLMLKIRLSRAGRKHVPFYRIVLTEHRKSAKNGYISVLGHYDATSKEFVFDREAAAGYIANGAQYSETMTKLLARFPR